MPPFPKPAFSYEYRLSSQIDALRRYRDTKPGRAIPSKAADRLLVATWNVANLGVQERREKDHLLIAELVSWFDLVAMQEVNDELLAFIYDSDKVALLEEVGEVAIPPSDIRYIKLPDIAQRFEGFDRNPY